MEKIIKILNVNIQLFAVNTNVTSDSGLSDEMKTFYCDTLIDMAKPELVHDQFGQKRNIPKNGGKTIEFRKYSPLPKAMTPLTEGVAPDGQKLSLSVITADIAQYGGYVPISDVLELTAIDNNLVEATKLLGGQAGATLDTVVREVLNGGTNVQYAEGQVAARNLLVGGLPVVEGAANPNHYLTVKAIKKAVRTLKHYNAKPFSGGFVAIIHPDVSFDLTEDKAWKDVKTYSDPKDIYEGEIGKIAGVRFVETTEAKCFGKVGKDGRSVYSTLILAENAYGTTEIEGGGLEHIVKQKGSAGTGDPLNQIATAGWKAIKTAERLVEPYMIRIETTSDTNGEAN